jgi:hypothetical protein
VRAAEGEAHLSAEVAYFHGVALSRLERLDEAERVLDSAAARHPQDKRFPQALAGVAFRRGDYVATRAHLRRAMQLDPGDPYTLDFLATLYLLEGNLEAALLRWNQMGKPLLGNVVTEPAPRLRPQVLDNTLRMAPGSVLLLEELHAARARLEMLNAFRRADFELQAREDGRFDLNFRPIPRLDLRTSRVAGAIAFFRGLPYQTVYPELFNLDEAGLNLLGLVRWDAERRRVGLTLTAPLAGDPAWGWRLDIDARNENWDVRRALELAGAAPAGGFNLQKVEAGAELRNVVNGSVGWRTGVVASHREFRGATVEAALAGEFLRPGPAVKHTAALDVALLRLPQHRFSVLSTAGYEAGRVFARGRGSFSFVRGSGGVDARWLPGMDDTYALLWQMRGAHTAGSVPADELFLLGHERDTGLLLRGRRAARGGRKGSAPLGRSFALSNLEFDRGLFRGRLVRAWVGPFLDGGQTWDPSPLLGTQRWQWDSGAQLKLLLIQELHVTLTWGRDLRAGSNVFFVGLRR